MKHYFMLVLLVACSLSATPVDEAKKLGHNVFTKDAWAASGQQQRGTMLHSFLTQQAQRKVTAKEIERLLGPPTGYYDYDENLAYVVGPKSIQTEHAQGYLVVFFPDAQSGKIKDIRIVPSVR